MLKYLRMQSPRTKMIWWTLIVVTVVTFIGGFIFAFGSGMSDFQPGRAPGRVAVVDGEPITDQQYRQALVEQRDLYRQQYKTEAQGRDELVLDVQAWRGLVNSAIMSREARHNGLRAWDPEIILSLKTSPPAPLAGSDFFKTEGRFDPQKYSQALRDPSNNWALFEQIAREQLPIRKLQERWVASIKVSKQELQMAYQDRFERVALAWVRVPPVAGGSVPAPSDSAIQKIYERHQGEVSGLAATRVDVLALPQPISDAEVTSVREQAQSLASRARAGESFADLARAYSAGPFAEQGGAIERVIARNDLGPALMPILPQMKAGSVTDAIQEGSVFFVFRVDSILPGTPFPSYKMSQIMLRIRPDADEQQKLLDKLQAIRNRARKAGLGPAAAERGLATQQTGYFDWNGGPPQLFGVPQAAEWALTAPLKAVSGIFQNEDQMTLVQVTGKRPAGPRPLDEVREQVRAMALTEAQIEQARPAAMRVAAELAKGASLDQAAGAVGLPVDRSEPFARRQADPRLAGVPEVVGAAFGLDSAGVAGPLRARDGWYFLKVERRVPPDVQAYQALEPSIRTQLLQQKQQAIFTSWVAALRERAKVQDLRSELGL